MSSTDIIPNKYRLDESKSEYQTNYEIIRSDEENCWICYSKNSINNVSEALRTIHLILKKCPAISEHFLQQIAGIIEKWTTNCFSFTLVQKCAQILITLLKSTEIMKQQEMENFLLNTFIRIMMAFDLIGDEINDKYEDDSEKTIKLIRLFIKVFNFIGENFNSPNSLSVVVGIDGSIPNPINLIFKLHFKWMKLHQLGLSTPGDKNIDEFTNECVDVETEIGKIFDSIFKYYSTAEVGEKIIPLMYQNFPIERPSEFFTPTFFEAYSSFVIFSSLCNEEHITQICSHFIDILFASFNGFPLYVTENAAQSIMKILNSGKLTVEMILSLIEKIEQAAQINKEKINHSIIPQLLILIENLFKPGTNLDDSIKNTISDKLIQLLLNCLPISYLDYNEQNIQSAGSFLFLVSLNHQMMNDPHNLALMCSLALVFIIIFKLPKQTMEQLNLFVRKVFSIEQAQLVFNEFSSLPLTERFMAECLEYIHRLNES